MLIVHHLNNSRSQRVLWLLEELGLPYEIKYYQRDPKTMRAPASLRNVHPLGKSPVVTDGDLTIAETGAIVEYLVEKAGGRLRPAAGTPERLRWTFWLHFAEGSAMTPLIVKLIFNAMPSRAPTLLRGLVRNISKRAQAGYSDPEIKAHFDYIENALARSAWFAGDEFSAADIMMSYPLESASRGGASQARPHVAAFIERIHARPAYMVAVDKGGPYAYAG
jgi:glutathione S-transferase